MTMSLSPTMMRVEAMRQIRNPYTLAFTLGMPVAMYLLFGASMGYGSISAGHGNVKFYVMLSMAAYGTAVAMSSLTSLAATEAKQGWGAPARDDSARHRWIRDDEAAHGRLVRGTRRSSCVRRRARDGS